MPDELDEILEPAVPRPLSEESHQHFFQQSLGQLRWGRRKRTLLRFGMFALVLVTGLGLGRWVWPLPPQPHEIAATQSIAEEPKLMALSAYQLELDAEKATDSQTSSQLYLVAGDRFLSEQNVTAALRCYRLHLLEGGESSRRVRNTDSWLMLSLKSSYSSENLP